MDSMQNSCRNCVSVYKQMRSNFEYAISYICWFCVQDEKENEINNMCWVVECVLGSILDWAGIRKWTIQLAQNKS